jgi:hypothetical protein
MDFASLPAMCVIVSNTTDMASIETRVPNSGQHAAFMCRLPFSDKVYALLNNDKPTANQTSNPIEMRDALGVDMEGALGKEVTVELLPRVFPDHRAHLFDFISLGTDPFPGIPFAHECILALVMPDVLAYPTHIHAEYWYMESRLYNLFSLLSATHGVFLTQRERSRLISCYTIYRDMSCFILL